MPITFAIHYKLAAMGASADDTKRDRALHPVYEAAGSAKFDGWLLHPPRDGEVDGGIAGVLPGTLAKNLHGIRAVWRRYCQRKRRG
jgi:hypothetical protein